MQALFARFLDRWRGATPGQRRTWTVVVSAALCLLAVTSTLVALMAHPGGATTARRSATATATSTDTATATNTATATATNTPRPTATPVPAKPVVISHPLPPPPALPPPPSPTPTATATAGGTPVPTPTPCTGPTYTGNNPSQSQIRAALDNAAARYSVPKDLVYAIAWQESKWHEDVTACDGGVGLMQIQYYLADYFNTSISYQTCGLGDTSYDIHVLQDNAYLGAKIVRYLECYYWYGAGYGGRPWPPNAHGDGTGYVNGSSAYSYWQAGLAYPDLTKADGTTSNPNGFCATVYRQGALYPDMPSSTSDYWSCPYTPTTGDNTLLDIVLSAYNAGQGAIYNCSCIPNPGYVANVETFIPQFASGALP